MSAGLMIQAAWENLSEGTPEERASFGLLEIAANDISLTEGQDTFVNRLRKGPLVSNYHCAEWFAWNWWRLRWEPRTNAQEWPFAHKMSSIGQGYVWPNIAIYSDGERIVLNAKPSSEGTDTPFRYIRDIAVVVRAAEFEGAVADYINQVISQLRAEEIGLTNLDTLWKELQDELQDPEVSLRRRLEALMGCEPGEASDEILDGLIDDRVALGETATYELAAHSAMSGHVRRASELEEVAASVGFEAHFKDAVQLAPDIQLPAIGYSPAWRRGAAAAKALREHVGLDLKPITNRELERLAGVKSGAIAGRGSIVRELSHDADLSFALETAKASRVVFRSKWQTGRRFELARLIGDRLTIQQAGKLRPATSAYTYRQQVQRSFAAEFLCPFDALSETLRGDYSAEAIEDAAHTFEVSERAVRSLLVNHGCIDRDELEGDIESKAATRNRVA